MEHKTRGNLNLIQRHRHGATCGGMCEDEVLFLYLLDILLKLTLGEDFCQAWVAHLVVNGVQKLLIQRL